MFWTVLPLTRVIFLHYTRAWSSIMAATWLVAELTSERVLWQWLLRGGSCLVSPCSWSYLTTRAKLQG